MKYFIVLVIFCLLFLSCNMEKNEKNRKTATFKNEDKKTESILTEKEDSEQMKDPVLYRQSLIQGVWAEHENEDALFKIEKDSLYYIEDQDEILYYNLIGDTLYVYGDVLTKFYIVKLNKNILWLKTDFYDEITKLYGR